MQKKLPIWLGVGGTPASFVRAGTLGLPLMIAIIGGETHRFRPLVDLYKQAGLHAGFKPEELIVGMHAFGYVADNTKQAGDEMYEGYKVAMSGSVAKDWNFPPVTRPRLVSVSEQKTIIVRQPKMIRTQGIESGNVGCELQD